MKKLQHFKSHSRVASFILVVFLLNACSTTGSLPVVTTTGSQGEVYPILVATNRSASKDSKQIYSETRANKLSFNNVSVWVPKNRKPGSVTYPSPDPSPEREFVATDIQSLEKVGFTNLLNKRLNKPNAKKEVILFIHGYNVNYSESVYRTAQIKADFKNEAVPVHFSWPSSGRILGYVYDRDSVQFARDALIELLEIISQSDTQSIFVVSHSMGTLLTMEAMRHLSLAKREDILRKISPLILASPDIDVDVFRSQMNSISVRPDPFIVFVAKNDSALRISKYLRGGHRRIGEGENILKLQEHGITVIDLTKVDLGVGSQHSAFASSPELIKLIHKATTVETTLNEADKESNVSPLKALAEFTKGLVYLPKKIIGK